MLILPLVFAGMQVGHMSLRAKLSKEVFDSEFQKAPCFAQFSSLGSLDAKWLHQEFQQTLSAGQCERSSGNNHMIKRFVKKSLWPD